MPTPSPPALLTSRTRTRLKVPGQRRVQGLPSKRASLEKPVIRLDPRGIAIPSYVTRLRADPLPSPRANTARAAVLTPLELGEGRPTVPTRRGEPTIHTDPSGLDP